MSEEKSNIVENIKTMLEKNEEIFDETGSYLYFRRAVKDDVKSLLELYEEEKAKNERLTKDNLDLDRLYRNTAVKLRENGKEELADYMLAQIGAVPTWTDFEDYIHWIHTSKIYDTIKDLQENNNGDDYSLTNVIMILKSLL